MLSSVGERDRGGDVRSRPSEVPTPRVTGIRAVSSSAALVLVAHGASAVDGVPCGHVFSGSGMKYWTFPSFALPMRMPRNQSVRVRSTDCDSESAT